MHDPTKTQGQPLAFCKQILKRGRRASFSQRGFPRVLTFLIKAFQPTWPASFCFHTSFAPAVQLWS